MTDTVLYFSLGFAIAGLFSVLILPIIWKQASQLTKRNIEATLPINSLEMAASQDLERAGFAVSIRQLELRIEELQQQAGKYWFELENSRNRISKLLMEQNEKKSQIETLQQEISQINLRNSKNDKKLNSSNIHTDNSGSIETDRLQKSSQKEVKQLEGQLALEKSKQLELDAKLVKLNTQLKESDEIRNSLTLQVRKTTEKLSDLEREVANAKNLPSNTESSKELLESKRSVESLSNKLVQTENQLNETQSELAKLQERVVQNQKNTDHKSVEQIRKLELELAGVIADRDDLKAENADLEARISESANEVESEVDDKNSGDHEMIRRKLSEFAAQFVALTANSEGGNTKVQEIMDSKSKDSKGPVETLANRIRKFSSLTQKTGQTSDKSSVNINDH